MRFQNSLFSRFYMKIEKAFHSIHIHTYISAKFHQEHRPSTKSLHRTRLLAWARSSPKDYLSLSFKTVRLQVALGHPLDLFPCGFHSKALWQISFSLFRRVCPIQPYFLLLISTFISDCPVLSHSSWLVIFRGHQIPSIFQRHLLTKACSFCVVLLVKNHVSQPYSRTDFTHALNSLILRCRLMLLALHTFFSLENAPRALFILCWMSKSVPPFSSILDPKYKKSSTRSIASSPANSGVLLSRWHPC